MTKASEICGNSVELSEENDILVEATLAILNTKYEKIEEICQEIFKLTEEDELEEEWEYLAELTDKYMRNKILLEKRKKQYAASKEVTPNRDTCISRTTTVKLPQISLKQFDGNILEWKCFQDNFKAAIHKNPTLSPIEKFTYLKTLLKGEASLVVENLPLTEEHYNTALV